MHDWNGRHDALQNIHINFKPSLERTPPIKFDLPEKETTETTQERVITKRKEGILNTIKRYVPVLMSST
jgi:hypothetical protein